MVSGCTECTMPFEAERASALANAALADHSRASASRETRTRAQDKDVQDAAPRARAWWARETGKLARALAQKGATHVLVLDHSRLMLDRAAGQFDGTHSSSTMGKTTRRALSSSRVIARGCKGRAVAAKLLATQADPAEALRRAVHQAGRACGGLRTRSVEADEAESSTRLDVDALVADLPLQSTLDSPRPGKTIIALGRDGRSRRDESESDVTFVDLSCGSVTRS